MSDKDLDKDITESSDSYRKEMSARDSQTSPELLTRLASNENYSVRSAVASRVEALPDETLNRLISDEDQAIRGLLTSPHG